MRAVLSLLALGLCSQAAFGKVQYTLQGVRLQLQPSGTSEHQGYRQGSLELQPSRTSKHVSQADVVSTGNRELQPSGTYEQSVHRQLATVEVWLKIRNGVPNTIVSIELTITKADGQSFFVAFKPTLDANGNGDHHFEIDDSFLNDDMDGVCDTCTIEDEQVSCPGGVCDDDLIVNIAGDPHMVGLLGQKIDWAGVDNGWYCLLSDGPNLHVNVRLSAPMPEEFPDRQLISAVSILTDDGFHSLVVEVKDPYSTTTHGCPRDSSVPCLADGGLRILVDGEESAAMQAPAVNVHLPGNPPVVVSSANLPAECRPFGGDRIWATQFAEMTNGRSLRSGSVSFAAWILQPDTLAAPTWCAKFLEEGGTAGLLSTPTEHATLRVETPVVTVRINVGMNYQDLETSPDGTVLLPELDFWQTDLGFDGLKLSGDVTGLMGDTSRYVLDDEGEPVTSGLGALHAPVESYRVAGPFARDFEKLYG